MPLFLEGPCRPAFTGRVAGARAVFRSAGPEPRPGVPRCIRPTGTTTGPPIDDLAVNLEEPRSARPPGGEWIEGRQAAERGASESASVVLFFARPPEAPRLPPQEEEDENSS